MSAGLTSPTNAHPSLRMGFTVKGAHSLGSDAELKGRDKVSAAVLGTGLGGI